MALFSKTFRFLKRLAFRYTYITLAMLFLSTPDVLGGIYPVHLKHTIETVLKQSNWHSKERVNLLMGTAGVESDCGGYLQGLGGPELGIFQMLPQTIMYTWKAVIANQDLSRIFKHAGYPIMMTARTLEEKMMWDLQFQVLMAATYYHIITPEPIPDTTLGQSQYWKQYWNTELGAGDTQTYVKKEKLCR